MLGNADKNGLKPRENGARFAKWILPVDFRFLLQKALEKNDKQSSKAV